jgi:hypothetical protein
VAAQHREDYDLLASKGDRGRVLELTGHSNRPKTQQGRRRGKAAPMAPVNPELGENGRR